MRNPPRKTVENRAGRRSALSLCAPDEREYFRDIERLTGATIEKLAVPTSADV
ncbi:MAG: hypothetical protein AAF654_10060 [Myxococcota bacterium]